VALFLGRFDNKVDRKGRVSVPAPYRAVLAAQAFSGIVAYPSPVNGAIDACGMDRMEQLAAGMETFNPFSDEFGAFATTILSQSHQLQFDGEGRVMLPEALIEHAGLSDMATFAGRGGYFQIWAPAAYENYLIEAKERARDEAARLEIGRSGGGKTS
jgi:MraZ protein